MLPAESTRNILSPPELLELDELELEEPELELELELELDELPLSMP